MHRVRARDFLFTGLIALAAYLLITKLAKIGFGTIADELRHSDLVWVARRAAPRPAELRPAGDRVPRRGADPAAAACPASSSSRR